MVKSKVIRNNIMAVTVKDVSHVPHDGNRHIADVQDTGIGAQPVHCLCHNGGWVGVVDNPVISAGILLTVINDIHHGVNGAQSIGKPARTAGFLANHIVF